MQTFVNAHAVVPGNAAIAALVRGAGEGASHAHQARLSGGQVAASIAVLCPTDYLDIFEAADTDALSVLRRCLGRSVTAGIWPATECKHFEEVVGTLTAAEAWVRAHCALGLAQRPATGEVLAPFATGHFVAGGMRGSQQMPLMPVPLGSGISYFDGPPIVTCAAFSMKNGRLTEPVDAFAHPFWDAVRARVSGKAIEMRRQGFVGAAMVPMAELEYTGITTALAALESRFVVRR